MFPPTYGHWCASRIYPTHCQFCGQRVYYFTCEHNSKFFLEDLGPPWPKHDCEERKAAQFDNAVTKYGKEWVAKKMAEMMATPLYFNSDYTRQVLLARTRMLEGPRQDPRRINREESSYIGVTTTEVGRIREMIPEVNLFKNLRIDDTPLWRKT